MEDHNRQAQTIDGESVMKPGEDLDRRVLDKIIVALESRLTEHVGHTDRRIAEIDAQVAIDLKAVLHHTAEQNSTFEKAVQQIDSALRASLDAAQQQGAEQILGLDQKLTTLQDTLPVKFREIVDAVRQAMEARLALELQALAAPTQQTLQQLEAKLTTLREELPPKIWQIVGAVEAAVDSRISTGDSVIAEQVSTLDRRLKVFEEELLSRFKAIEGDVLESMAGVAQLREALSAATARLEEGDQRLSAFEEAMPPKFKAIMESVRQFIDTKVAEELKSPAFEEGVIQLRQALSAVNVRLESDDQRVGALDRKLTLLHEELPPKFKAIIDMVRESLSARVGAELQAIEEQHRTRIQLVETRLVTELQALDARASATAELEKALQHYSALDARLQALEQKPQPSSDETVDRAVERVWQSLQSRLFQQTEPGCLPASIGALRQKSASAEQSVLDLIASMGQIFEKPSAPAPEPSNGVPSANGMAASNGAAHQDEPEAEAVLTATRSGRKWRIPLAGSSS